MAYGKYSKPGAAPCGLYIGTPTHFTGGPEDFLRDIRQIFLALNASEYEKNFHVIEFRPQNSHDAVARFEAGAALCALTRRQGFIFIVDNDIGLAKMTQADGVIVKSAQDVRRARDELGPDSIIGMRCGSSRDLASAARDEGADYVSFAGLPGILPDPGLFSWWKQESTRICVAQGKIANDDAGSYVQAGADFIEGTDYIWSHPEGVMKGVVNLLYAIDLANEKLKN
jgi:thiamine-phosphate pyrophosphorylase